MVRKMNPVFDKQVADVALSRGLSRASVLCALLVASDQAYTQKIAPEKYDQVFYELAFIPQDIAKSAACNNLCRCRHATNYDADFEDEREKHLGDCLYVAWRDLIEDPLESILDDRDEEDYNDG